jgi:hypothetical protein
VQKAEEKVSLELKYCERCGGLWLRSAGSRQIYCVACAREIAEMPPSRELDAARAEPKETPIRIDRSEGAQGAHTSRDLEAWL